MDKEETMRNRLKEVVKERNKSLEHSQKRSGKEKIKQLVESCVKTIMIGELAKFEAFFGELWGQGLEDKDCTQKQREFYDIWQQCRHEILNYGNKNLRDLLSKIESYYEVVYKGNSVKMFKE